MIKWTPEEESILRENYNKTYGELINLLPKRTKKAIEDKIKRLDLPRTKENYIDVNEIYNKYNRNSLVIYEHPIENRREVICIKQKNEYVDTDCHIVLSHAKDKDGYAEMSFNNKRGKIRIHRYIYEKFNGEIKEGNIIRHMCHNPSCCNPEHLVQGTHQENSTDMVLAGRTIDQKGSNNHTSILTEDVVKEIKLLYKEGTRPIDIVNKFDLNRSTVNNIIYEYQWKHVVV